MKKTNKIISALLSIVFIAAFSITSNDSILVFKNLSISASAEATSNGFVYNISNNQITITGYNGTSSQISIPSTINGYSVTTIGSRAFEDNTNLTKVILPESAILLMGDVFTYNSDTILYCVKGSYAEKYATIKGFNVEYIETGDINYDLIIDIKDIIRLKKLTADGTEKFSAADLVQDGEIDSLDLAALRQKLISG